MVFALDREWVPLYKLGWRTRRAAAASRLDERHRRAASTLHQKGSGSTTARCLRRRTDLAGGTRPSTARTSRSGARRTRPHLASEPRCAGDRRRPGRTRAASFAAIDGRGSGRRPFRSARPSPIRGPLRYSRKSPSSTCRLRAPIRQSPGSRYRRSASSVSMPSAAPGVAIPGEPVLQLERVGARAGGAPFRARRAGCCGGPRLTEEGWPRRARGRAGRRACTSACRA